MKQSLVSSLTGPGACRRYKGSYWPAQLYPEHRVQQRLPQVFVLHTGGREHRYHVTSDATMSLYEHVGINNKDSIDYKEMIVYSSSSCYLFLPQTSAAFAQVLISMKTTDITQK